MHQSYGMLIKLTRIEKNIKQEELCEGICTPSYLSRIENDRVVADEQIYKLLLYKLGVELKKDTINIEQIDAQIEQWYEHFILNEDTPINIELLKEKARFTNNETYLKFKLIYCRYLLKLDKLDEAKKYIFELEKMPMLNSRLNFLFANVMILFYYKDKQYLQAIEIGEKILPESSFNTYITPLELGIFFYNLASVYKKLYEYDRSIDFGRQALQIFEKGYFLECALRCHVLLAICYNNTQKFELALNTYELAQKIIPFLPPNSHSHHYSIIENNIGKCYENLNNYNQALHYYIKTFENPKNDDKIFTIVNIIRCYYKLDNLELGRYWLEVSKSSINKTTSDKYIYQLKIFSVLFHNRNISSEDLKKLQEDSIHCFINEDMNESIVFYCKIFAKLYKERNLYKKVSEMYELALYTIENKNSRDKKINTRN